MCAAAQLGGGAGRRVAKRDDESRGGTGRGLRPIHGSAVRDEPRRETAARAPNARANHQKIHKQVCVGDAGKLAGDWRSNAVLSAV